MVLDLGPLLYSIIGFYVLLGIALSVTLFWAVRGFQRYVHRRHEEAQTGELKHFYGFHLRPNSTRH